MMTKKNFDFGLYKEALRQLRVIGFMCLVIICLGAILTPLGYIIDSAHAMVRAGEVVGQTRDQVRLMDINLLLPACYVVAAPLMTLHLFYFMNRRDSSDFYHSVPHTRICLFSSFFAAIATWLTVLIIGSDLAAMIMCGIGSKYLALNMASVPAATFQVFAASLLVAAGVALAMCLTGTIFTNVMVTGLLLFMPRLIMLVITECIDSALPFVAAEYSMELLSYEINVVTGSVFGVLIGNPTAVFYNYAAGIYTLLLALIYAAVACILFHRRKSESAGHAAQGKKLQLVFRMAVALVICLIPIVIIFNALVEEYSMDSGEIFLLVVLYIIAAAAYFIYELISTRKWRNMIKAVPGLGVLAVVNVVLILGMYGICRFHSNVLPEADEIDYVTLPAEMTGNYWFSGNINDEDCYDYFDSAAETIRLTSSEVREMISERLAETVSYYTSDEYILDREQRYTSKTVAIKSGMLTYHRYIQLTDEDIRLLMNELKNHDSVEAAYQELPEVDDSSVILNNMYDLGQENVKAIYNVMRQEIQEVGFETWYGIQEGMDFHSNILDRLYLSLYQGTRPCVAELPIVPELPKTWEKYMEESIMNVDREFREEAIRVMTEGGTVTYFSISREGTEEEGSWYANENTSISSEEAAVCYASPTSSVMSLTDETRALLAPMLASNIDAIPTAGEPYYRVYIEWITLDEDGEEIYQGYDGFFGLDEEEMPEELLEYLMETE